MFGSRFEPGRLETLYRVHREELFRYAARFTGDPDLAADVVQEAFVKLALHPPANDNALRAWLFRTATTIAIDAQRSSRRRALLHDRHAAELPLGTRAPDPAHSAEQSELRRQVHAALDTLSPRDRAALLMRVEGFSYREIAAAVGTTTNAVGVVLARAMAKLAPHLADQQRSDR